jgi:hypothetical protein
MNPQDKHKQEINSTAVAHVLFTVIHKSQVLQTDHTMCASNGADEQKRSAKVEEMNVGTPAPAMIASRPIKNFL